MKSTTGAKMLRADLELPGLSFEDSSGRRFDFHCLRAHYATTLHATGATLRTMQTLMRHSIPILTARCIKPRAFDVERAALAVPSLKPASHAHQLPQTGDAAGPNPSHADTGVSSNDPEKMDHKWGGSRELSRCDNRRHGEMSSDPDGTRTRAACVKGMCPNH